MSSLCVLCKIYASKEDTVFVFGVEFRVELLFHPFLLDSNSIFTYKNYPGEKKSKVIIKYLE
jgi:hypothetical protein